MSAKIECEYYTENPQISDNPWCMWGGVNTNKERCEKCLEEQRDAEEAERIKAQEAEG